MRHLVCFFFLMSIGAGLLTLPASGNKRSSTVFQTTFSSKGILLKPSNRDRISSGQLLFSDIFQSENIDWVRIAVTVNDILKTRSRALIIYDPRQDMIISKIKISRANRDDIQFPDILIDRFQIGVLLGPDQTPTEMRLQNIRVVVRRSEGTAEKPKLLMGRSIGNLVGRRLSVGTPDPEVTSRRQSSRIAESWDTANRDTFPAIPDKLLKLKQSVVRLKRIAPACEVWPDMTKAQIKSQDDNFLGCTAFRVGHDLFATAWHCMSDQRNNCQTTSIQFGYDFKKSGSIAQPVFGATEQCKKIVYLNRQIDLALFRVTTKHLPKWSNAPILAFLGDASRFWPFQGEPLAVLHYPWDNCAIAQRLREDANGNQLGLRISRFLDGKRHAEECKVHKIRNSVKYRIDPPPRPKTVCERSRAIGLRVGIGHGCAACAGSSGSPILSMSRLPDRYLGVVGLHVNGPASRTIPYRGVRATAINDCIDVEALSQNKIVVRDARKYRYCECDIPKVCGQPPTAEQLKSNRKFTRRRVVRKRPIKKSPIRKRRLNNKQSSCDAAAWICAALGG